MFRRFDPMVVFDLPQRGGGFLTPVNGVDLFVDTVNGNDARTGQSWDKALATVGQALTLLGTPRGYTLPGHRKGSNSRIFVIGDVREHASAPENVFGVKIIGGFAGRPRHVTEDGAVNDGNGAAWRDTAVAGSAPLLTTREQGWEVHNMMFVPPSGYAGIRWRREETDANRDASHAIVSGCRFVSAGTRVGYGIDDYGSQSHCAIIECEFDGLEYAYQSGNVGISAANRHLILRNHFHDNKNDVYTNCYGVRIEDNVFGTVYNASTHPNTINLAATADAGTAANPNLVLRNQFKEATANVTIAKGFVPGTGDVWRNYVSDAADPIVTVPA